MINLTPLNRILKRWPKWQVSYECIFCHDQIKRIGVDGEITCDQELKSSVNVGATQEVVDSSEEEEGVVGVGGGHDPQRSRIFGTRRWPRSDIGKQAKRTSTPHTGPEDLEN